MTSVDGGNNSRFGGKRCNGFGNVSISSTCLRFVFVNLISLGD